MTCSAADYEAAATAICNAIATHAETRKKIDSKAAAGALLEVTEFHDRCMRLARSISFERDRQHASTIEENQ